MIMENRALNGEDASLFWERRRKTFNLYAISSGIGCLIIMRLFNNASVNFFMLPFLGVYFVVLNIGYTMAFVLYKNRSHSAMEQKKLKTLFIASLSVTLAINATLAVYTVLSISHR